MDMFKDAAFVNKYHAKFIKKHRITKNVSPLRSAGTPQLFLCPFLSIQTVFYLFLFLILTSNADKKIKNFRKTL